MLHFLQLHLACKRPPFMNSCCEVYAEHQPFREAQQIYYYMKNPNAIHHMAKVYTRRPRIVVSGN